MGKNPHPPRHGLLSKKPPPKKDEDDSFIVFSNAKDDPKKTRSTSTATASTTQSKSNGQPKESAPENEPKKPTTRELIAGASWTGKLPMTLLAEHCQKQKWEKPEYSLNRNPEGFYCHVLLKFKNSKTQEMLSLPPIKISPNHKQLAVQASAAESRHFAAAYALHRICSMRNYHLMLPPYYRDLWKGDFEEIKKEDVAAGRAWMYDADPFLAQKNREAALAQLAAQRAARAKEQAARDNPTPGQMHVPGLGNGASPKGWAKAPKVDMGQKTRREVENLLRAQAVWNPDHVQIPLSSRTKIVDELASLGFRGSHVDEAAEVCKDRAEVLDWLLIHVPEDDLPSWTFPEGYVAGVSMASGNVRREAAVKRLNATGYALEMCEQAYDSCKNDELAAAERLQESLLKHNEVSLEQPEITHPQAWVNVDEDTSTSSWQEEQGVLRSILEDRFEKLGEDQCQVHLEDMGDLHGVIARFRKPRKSYPYTVPLLSIIGPLPSYIRLSIVRQALIHAAANYTGEQMIFSIVDWLEREISRIVANPGKLIEIASVASIGAFNTAPRHRSPAYARRRQLPFPIRWQPGTERSLKILSEWKTRQDTPAQQKMLRTRQSLPAWKLQEAIVQCVNTHQVVIISGETGSGKSTQCVQYILDDLIARQLGEAVNIVCTQPRRISALGLADRVADERCSPVGREIGYSIRGDSKHIPGITKVTFVTTGVLLRRLQISGGSGEDVVAALADLSHVVVDEVHERNLDTDFLLALLRDVLKVRRDLKIILMSATLDADVFERYFDTECTVGKVDIEGRTFPVEDYFIDDVARMTAFSGISSHIQNQEGRFDDQVTVKSTLSSLGGRINYDLIAALVQHVDSELGSHTGGILIFLPGTMEINRTIDALRGIPHLHTLPLHASLLPTEQRRVFPPAPNGKRKVIAATNVAETSITIEDIVAVIDTGRVKETRYDPIDNMVKLEEVWASRAACKQRRGRAGRVRAGQCYKLYTRSLEARMPDRPEPEIRRVPLEQLCLSVKAMGVSDVADFLSRTLTPPESLAVEGALDILRRMGAIDGDVLTALGRHMAMIPTDLRCAKLMVYGALLGCLETSVTIAAILTSRSPFVSPQDKRNESQAARSSFANNEGDVLADLHAYEAWSSTRRSHSTRDLRAWCDANFLSLHSLTDIHTTRTQYLSSLTETGFLPATYTPTTHPHYNRHASSPALLQSLLLCALHPHTLLINLPTQKYTPTAGGTLALAPASREVKYHTASARVFLHPSSTLFAAPHRANARFLSYFSKVSTSKAFVREVTPCGVYGLLLFGGGAGGVEVDTEGRGLVVDGWVRVRGWARIGVLVSRLRGVLDGVLRRWVEEPGEAVGAREEERRVVDVVRRLVELEGMDV